MGWASDHIARLKRRETVRFRARGGSMTGRIESGQLCTVEPVVDPTALRVDDIVLRKVHGAEYLHPIGAIEGERVQIGNHRGDINGWVGGNAISGKCVKVES